MEWTKFDWFLLGLAIGLFWLPVWRIGKRVLEEVQIARKEWRQPVDKDRQ
jgi:hypothetical protein